MARTVVALYDNLEDARGAIEELVNNGIQWEDISLVANDAEGQFKTYQGGEGMGKDAGEDAMKGAGIGGALGGIAGLMVGLGALAIPGIGPIVAAGPIAAGLAGAGIGAAAGGLIGALTNLGIPENQAEVYAEGVRRGGHLVTVNVPDYMSQQAVDIMNSYHPIDLNRRATEWRSQNWQGFDPNATPYSSEDIRTERMRYQERMDTEGEVTMPVVEEELKVGKRDVEEGGIRATSRTTEEEVEEQVNLREEHIDVERRPVDRTATPEDFDKFSDETIEVKKHREEPIVSKEAHVTEEVTIRKEAEEHAETIRDTLKRKDVDIEDMDTGREDVEGMGSMRSERRSDFTDYSMYEPMFQNHFQTSFTHMGGTYEDYAPAYRYGYDLAYDERFRDRDWSTLEMDARRDWEMRYPDSPWENFKEAVRTGWESVTGRR